MHFSLKT
jgi:chaperonin GroEL (HSP60 family)